VARAAVIENVSPIGLRDPLGFLDLAGLAGRQMQKLVVSAANRGASFVKSW